MFAVNQVFNQRQGPLPISAVFNSGGGTLVIIFSGSGWANSVGNIGVFITINGVSVGNARTWTNETSSHKAFTTQALVLKGYAAGALTLGITPIQGVSRPKGLHLRPLAEPDMTVSRHPAPIRQTHRRCFDASVQTVWVA